MRAIPGAAIPRAPVVEPGSREENRELAPDGCTGYPYVARIMPIVTVTRNVAAASVLYI